MICKVGLPVVSSFAVGELLQGLLGCIHLSGLAAADELYMVWGSPLLVPVWQQYAALCFAPTDTICLYVHNRIRLISDAHFQHCPRLFLYLEV